MTTEDSWDSFIAIMNNTEDTGFQKTLENYSTALSSLKEGFLGISNGTLDQDGIYIHQFPLSYVTAVQLLLHIDP